MANKQKLKLRKIRHDIRVDELKQEYAKQQARDYIDWCYEHVSVRREDGTERPVDTNEAIEFIMYTMSLAE